MPRSTGKREEGETSSPNVEGTNVGGTPAVTAKGNSSTPDAQNSTKLPSAETEIDLLKFTSDFQEQV